MCKNQINKPLLLRCKNVCEGEGGARDSRGLIKYMRIQDFNWTKLSEQILVHYCLKSVSVFLHGFSCHWNEKHLPVVLVNSLLPLPPKRLVFWRVLDWWKKVNKHQGEKGIGRDGLGRIQITTVVLLRVRKCGLVSRCILLPWSQPQCRKFAFMSSCSFK